MMHTFSPGNYLGSQIDSYSLSGITITKSEYGAIANKDWHCHENAFFAYFLKGGNYEYRGAKEIKCSAGSLLFYKAMEPHCNRFYIDGSKIFHVEINNDWLSEYGLKDEKIKADLIGDVNMKSIFKNILNEFAIRDELSKSSIGHMLIYLLNLLLRNSNGNFGTAWTKKFDLIVNDSLHDSPTLKNISKQLNIHPVTLSKEFYKYYHCSFGDYIRALKVERSLSLLAKKNIPVNDVAYQCGFSDASNFIRSFKKVKGITPGNYRQLV